MMTANGAACLRTAPDFRDGIRPSLRWREYVTLAFPQSLGSARECATTRISTASAYIGTAGAGVG
jgi:hypothetical protein